MTLKMIYQCILLQSFISHASADVYLSYSVPQELASLGLDRLKSALMALGLKCGG